MTPRVAVAAVAAVVVVLALASSFHFDSVNLKNPHDPLRTFYPQQRQAWDSYSKCWLFYPKFRFFATNPFLF